MEKKNIYCINDIDLEKQKLKRLRNKIIWMKESKEKAILINNYRIYSYYLYLLTGDNNYYDNRCEFEECLSYKKYSKSFYQADKDLGDSIDILCDIFKDIQKFNDQEGINSYIKLDKRIDEQTGFLLIEEFFANLSPYIYKIYKNIMNNNIAYLLDDNAYALDIAYCASPKVISYKNLKSYETYKSIVHEIGHCYQFILNANSNNIYFDQIDVEMTAIFMETLFNLFVNDKLYNENYGMNSLFSRQSLMAYTGSIQNILLNVSDINWIENERLYGDVFFDKLTDEDILVLERSFGYKFVKKKDYFTLGMEINNFKYTISNLLALYFVDIYLQDKKEGLRLLKDYIMLPSGVTFKEKLDNYNIDSYKKINKPIYEYGRRIHKI